MYTGIVRINARKNTGVASVEQMNTLRRIVAAKK